MNRLTSRERTMLVAVLATLFVVGNFIVLSSLFQRYSELRRSFSSKQMQLNAVKLILSQRQAWAVKDGWLDKNQPKLKNREQSGVMLLDEVKTAAKAFDVLLDKQNLGSNIDVQPTYQAVSVQVETQSTWPNLINFLHRMQQPDHFIVFESASVEIDSTDATKMRGKFTIAKWYAPEHASDGH